MQVSDVIKVLYLVGEGYRSKDGTKPADAIEKIISQFKGAENLTIEAWIASRQKRKRLPDETKDENLGDLLLRLERSTSTGNFEQAFQQLDNLSLSASQLKNLAKLVTGKGPRSKDAAIIALKTHLASCAQSQDRKLSVIKAFS